MDKDMDRDSEKEKVEIRRVNEKYKRGKDNEKDKI